MRKMQNGKMTVYRITSKLLSITIQLDETSQQISCQEVNSTLKMDFKMLK